MTLDPRDLNVPDVLLERFRLGELPEAEQARIARAVTAHPEIAARLAALDASDADLRGAIQSHAMARGIEARLAQRGTRRPSSKVVGLMVVATAATIVLTAVMLTRPAGMPSPVNDGPAGLDDRLKGLDPSLMIYRQTTQGSERLTDDTIAHAGDLLRLGYVAAGASYGVIISLDGRGVVTLHLPAPPPASDAANSARPAAPLAAGSPVLLEHSYELDDAPKAERFYFVTSGSPFGTSAVMDAARRAATEHPGAPPVRLTLPDDLHQFTIAVRKDGSRAK